MGHEPTSVMRIIGPARCVIRVRGMLAPEWSDSLGDMRITCERQESGAVTQLIGRLMDQAALHGVLSTLYELGYPLISVDCVPEKTPRPDA